MSRALSASEYSWFFHKHLWFTLIRPKENVFFETPLLLGMNRSLIPLCKTIPHKFIPTSKKKKKEKNFLPWKVFFGKKSQLSILWGRDTMRGSPKIRLKAKGTSWNSNAKDNFMARYSHNYTFLHGGFLWAAW